VDLVPNFHIKELVSKCAFEAFKGNRDFLLSRFSSKGLETLQALRNRFGVTLVNNWHINGENQYRGFREYDCPIGARFSQHKLGNAFDCSFVNFTAEEVRRYILDNPQEFPYITAIEGQVSWLHFDVRPSSWDGIKVFNP